MKARYNRSAVAAQNIMRQTARENGVTYEYVYREIEAAIRHGLSSSEPEAVDFWNDVKKKARTDRPTPEDVILHTTTEAAMRLCSPKVQFGGRMLH